MLENILYMDVHEFLYSAFEELHNSRIRYSLTDLVVLEERHICLLGMILA